MKKIPKKLLSVVLTVLMIVSIVPIGLVQTSAAGTQLTASQAISDLTIFYNTYKGQFANGGCVRRTRAALFHFGIIKKI